MSSNFEKNFDSRSGLDRDSQEVLDWRLAAVATGCCWYEIFFISSIFILNNSSGGSISEAKPTAV